MKATTVTSIALLVVFAGSALRGELKSGLQPGDLATPFEVQDVTGPNKGISLCYR